MKRNVYSVFDHKALGYLQPFFAPNHQVATRHFRTAAQDPQHDFCRYAEDYTLFFLGTFDEEQGLYEQPQSPEPVVKAIALAREE